MNKGRQAILNLRKPGMRYRYMDIVEMIGGIASESLLCRIMTDKVTPSADVEKALVSAHNKVCKRGEKL